MKPISNILLHCFLFTTYNAWAGTVAAVPSPKLDALTNGRSITASPSTTIVATPVARSKSPVRINPAPSTTPTPTATPTTSTPAVIEAAIPNTIPTPDITLPRLYFGAQLGDSIVGGLVGLQINKMYSLEARYDYVDTIYLPAGNTKSSNVGVAGVALFPLKLSDMEPFYLYAKVGYERSTVKTMVTDPGIPPFPATTRITTTVRGRVLIGGGGQYDFSKKIGGRVGVNFIGSDHSIYLTVLYKL